MRSKIFWKFYFAFLFLVFLSLLSSYFYLRSQFTQANIHQTAESMDRLMGLVLKSLEGQKPARWDSESLEPLVDHLAEGAVYRITLIDRQGKVVADSEVSGPRLAELENHSNRPEVREALAQGWGESLRYSTSIQKEMLYVARPYPQGVIRVSMPLTYLKKPLQELKSVLFYGLWVGGIVSALISLWAARRFSKPLRELTVAAQAMAQRNFQVKVPVRGGDEISSLSRSFNELSKILGDLVQELVEEKNLLRATLDSMLEGVIVLDPSGKIVLSNPAFKAMFSLSQAPEGFTPIELFRSAELQEIVQTIVAGKECKNAEVEMQREGLRFYLVQGAPFASEQGIEGSVLVFYDITSLRRLEKVRKDFVANVSHELKTPLTAIKGYAETLMSGALEDRENAPKFLKIIEQHADRLNRIVLDLLDLSKIESDQYRLQLERVELEPFLEDLRLTFERPLAEKKIHLEIRKEGLDMIWCDGSALRQVLSNLLDNAIKYTQAGGLVELTAEARGANALFCVRDTGPGIPPEHLPRIFERFYRVDPSRSRQQGGTGLGLSIVKHLVQLHGGEIRVESELGKGSAFRFSLPQAGLV